MNTMIDLEKAEKLPPAYRYLNISVIWIFYYRLVLKILYVLRIPHEAVTSLSILSGLISAYLFYHVQYVPAAIALHFKDVFDACDGALARLTGRGHLIGRYLDSLGDFFVISLVMIAIALNASASESPVYIFWAVLAILSTFIQCSFFNYYQLAYLERFGIDRLSSKKDEIDRDDINFANYNFSGRIALRILRLFYIAIYGWQDRLVAHVDRMIYNAGAGNSPSAWYGHKPLMVQQSALCFGTHIFVIIVFALFHKPRYALIFIGTIMNFYMFYLLHQRKRCKMTQN